MTHLEIVIFSLRSTHAGLLFFKCTIRTEISSFVLIMFLYAEAAYKIAIKNRIAIHILGLIYATSHYTSNLTC